MTFDSKFPKDFTFSQYPPIDLPKEVVGHIHSEHELGYEDGYWRLPDHAIIQEGDETYGAMTNTWETANKWQIGKMAKEVGGFFIWRRKL